MVYMGADVAASADDVVTADAVAIDAFRAAEAAPAHPSSALTARTLRSARELDAAASLYSRVFAYAPGHLSVNPLLLHALMRNGGSVVGVFAGTELVGFAYGFAARDRNRHEFHYSQAAVVAPEYQGRGVGRMLKRHQAKIAQEWGFERMRWAFDPMLTRNGHFNLDSLGGRGIEFCRDYYARPNSDRVIVEWDFRGERHPPVAGPPEFAPQQWGSSVPAEVGTWIVVPRHAAELDAQTLAQVRARLRESLDAVMARGHALVSCLTSTAETAAYLAAAPAASSADTPAVSLAGAA